MLKCKKCGKIAPTVENVRPKGGEYVKLCPACLDEWLRKATNEDVILGGLK